MKEITEIVERKEKPVIKIFLLILGSVFLINFVIFVVNRYVERYPYISNIIVIFLTVISCTLILINYFSKYSYTIFDEQIIFNRIIGKREFEMLRLSSSDVIAVYSYNKEIKKKKYIHNFTFKKERENLYLGEYKKDGKVETFLFSPSEKLLKELNKELKK
ncbi:hypothetical protein KQI42_03530 [Tissierella sp. MSJ-40]|uniref:DUF304 domain-containing protein n=1 Tax=Tissierella simiarum TaxID=2841534 RepID=A0ABS6E2K5_9FIRM|nr:hypothetical protein [Tissierella simiarum]MBU5437066.1 hypothetical protein [Tissierella simiarum]